MIMTEDQIRQAYDMYIRLRDESKLKKDTMMTFGYGYAALALGQVLGIKE